jgi:hypothetical protein
MEHRLFAVPSLARGRQGRSQPFELFALESANKRWAGIAYLRRSEEALLAYVVI